MITIRLMGGLCNQLWGYGLGRSLGQKQEVQFDISSYAQDTKRNYSLSNLGLNLPLGVGKGRVIHEVGLEFKPEIFDIVDDVTLVGYWQHAKYIEPAKHRILSEVFLNFNLSYLAKKWAVRIAEVSSSAFIHVRRGDYLVEPHASFHGNVGMLYYESGMAIIRERNPNTHFFIFSDDKQWCNGNFESGCTVVGGTNEFEDLYLGSLCRNGIIANSSFSWWQAFLDPEQQGGVVVAPKHWFKDKSVKEDIALDRWIKI